MADIDTTAMRRRYSNRWPVPDEKNVLALCDEIDDLRARLARQHEHLLSELARRYKADDKLAAVEALHPRHVAGICTTCGNAQWPCPTVAAARGEVTP